MKLEIQHFTKYHYTDSVILNPHHLFLIPQQRSYFKTERQRIQIDPKASAIHERIDMMGNTFYQTWFEGETTHLSIEVDYIIQVEPFNPYGFLFSDFIPYPFSFFEYSLHEKVFLKPFLETEKDGNLIQYVVTFIQNRKDIVSFLFSLTESIHGSWEHLIREEENLWNPAFTFQYQKGSCRDLSWMLIHMLRNVGLAARFVSGYAFNPELSEGHELHAWAEVYLPGAGWIGLDPSLGLFADNNYIPLASGFYPEQVAPVIGTFGGNASSNMHAEVWIRNL